MSGRAEEKGRRRFKRNKFSRLIWQEHRTDSWMHGSVLISKFIRVFTIYKRLKYSPNNQNKSTLIRKLNNFDAGIFCMSY